MNCYDFSVFIDVISDWNDYVNDIYNVSGGAIDIGMTETATLADNYIALIAKNLCDEHYEDIIEILFWFIYVDECGTKNYDITDIKPDMPTAKIGSCKQMYDWFVENYNL